MATPATFIPAQCLTGRLCLKSTQNISAKKVVSPSRLPRTCTIWAAHVKIVPPSQDAEKKEEPEETVVKVFADDTKGILCYQTESGEVVCEGMDEGPHFYPPCGANFYIPDARAAAMLPLLGEGMYEI